MSSTTPSAGARPDTTAAGMSPAGAQAETASARHDGALRAPNGASQPVLQCQGLRKHYDQGARQLTILKHVDFTVAPGEVVAIVGASGSGKSTLLRCMNHLEEPTAGEVVVDGITLSSEANINKVREEVGMVFQRFNLFPHMTALGNVMEAPVQVRGLSKDGARHRGVELLERVGLGERLDHYPSQLSGGQQQRVAIVRALLARPEVVFADEPTGNLDSNSGAEVLRLLRAAATDHAQTILMVTHDASAASYADRVVFIKDGMVAGEMIEPTYDAVLGAMAQLEGR